MLFSLATKYLKFCCQFRHWHFILHLHLNHRQSHLAIHITNNTPGIKKEWPRTKRGLAEKDLKSNGRLRPPGFDRFKSFGHDDLTTKHCYSRCSRPLLMLMVSKFLIKMTRPQNIVLFTLMFCSLVIFINFDPTNIRRP